MFRGGEMKLTIIENPFDNSSRIVKDIVPDKPVLELVRPYLPDCEYNIILDNQIIPAEKAKTIIPTENQTLAVRAAIRGGHGSNHFIPCLFTKA